MEKYLTPIARVMIAHIFLLAGMSKIGQYAGTQAYMDAMGVPGALLPLVILLEIGGGLALIVGFQARWVAAGLAIFSIVSAAIFHANFADQMQMIMFMKNVTLAGGLLLLTAYGAGNFSIDNYLSGRRNKSVSGVHAAA